MHDNNILFAVQEGNIEVLMDQQLVIIEEQLTEEQLNNPIYQLIKDTTDGKTIVKYYLTHNHVEKNLRNLLTRIILRAEANKIFGPVDINNEPKSLPNSE
ncbi:uncharacterized protein [Chelonus insularis]|uniref:uncharacterized protein n=1 Tax=Chelonus insularis TaxID=460826 RepID=UPI00158D27DE|nr:uncharacterized protein LOC118070149 [Chelonus insularis]